MPDPNPQPTSAPTDLDRLWALLDALVPPGEASTAEDRFGAVHELPKILSARRQIAVARHLKSFWAALKKADELDTLAAAWAARSPTDLIGGLLDAMSEEALDALDKSFAAAFPEALETARGGGKDPSAPATEIFPVEAVVGSLLPFASRLLRRGGGVITKLAEMEKTPTETATA